MTSDSLSSSDTRDIVVRLRSRGWEDRQHRQLREEAASQIERLRGEVIQLELSRQHIGDLISGHDGIVFDEIAKALGIQPDEEQQ